MDGWIDGWADADVKVGWMVGCFVLTKKKKKKKKINWTFRSLIVTTITDCYLLYKTSNGENLGCSCEYQGFKDVAVVNGWMDGWIAGWVEVSSTGMVR